MIIMIGKKHSAKDVLSSGPSKMMDEPEPMKELPDTLHLIAQELCHALGVSSERADDVAGALEAFARELEARDASE